MSADDDGDTTPPVQAVQGQLSLFGDEVSATPGAAAAGVPGVPTVLVVARGRDDATRMLGGVILNPPDRIYVPPVPGNAGHVLNEAPAFRRFLIAFWGTLVVVSTCVTGLLYAAHAFDVSITVTSTIVGSAGGAGVATAVNLALGHVRRRAPNRAVKPEVTTPSGGAGSDR